MKTIMKSNGVLKALASRLHLLATASALTISAMFPASLHAALSVVLHEHTGSNDPTSEGWTLNPPVGSTLGAVVDGGTPAWFINNSTPGDNAFYKITPSVAEVQLVTTFGWSLQTTLHMTAPSLTPGGSMLALFRDGSTSYQMHFGTDASGNAMVVLADNTGGFNSTAGLTYTTTTGDVFNTFELRYSPTEGSADLFVNGVERISDYTGFDLLQTQLAFGDGSSRDLTGLEPGSNISAANYFETVFSSVPEPGTALFGMACVGVAALRRRRRA